MDNYLATTYFLQGLILIQLTFYPRLGLFAQIAQFNLRILFHQLIMAQSIPSG